MRVQAPAPDPNTALLKQQAITKLAAVPAKLHETVTCAGKGCKYGGVIPNGTMPLIACQGACIADWTGQTKKEGPNMRSALDFTNGNNGKAVCGFKIKPGYNGACIFCPDCFGRGAHKVPSTKPGVPDQCVACVTVYEAEEKALNRESAQSWKMAELKALKEDGMVCFPLLPHPLPAHHLMEVNNLAWECKDAAEELKDFELEASGGGGGEEAKRGDMLYLKRNFQLTGQELRTLIDTLHARMREEASLKDQLEKWVSNHKNKKTIPDEVAALCASASSRGKASTRRCLQESDDEEEAEAVQGDEDSDEDEEVDDGEEGEEGEEGEAVEADDGEEGAAEGGEGEEGEDGEEDAVHLADLRARLAAASRALEEAKEQFEAKAAQLAESKELLNAASSRAAKSSAAAAAAGSSSRPKPKTTGTTNGSSAGAAKKTGGASKSISKKEHTKLEKIAKRQFWQSRERNMELAKMKAVREAQEKWIMQFILRQLAGGDNARMRQQMQDEFQNIKTTVEDGFNEDLHMANPDDIDYDTDKEGMQVELPGFSS